MNSEDLEGFKTTKKAIGAKQAARAVEKGLAARVYLADDADRRVVAPLAGLCSQKGIQVKTGLTMAELGKACGIEVAAAAVALLK
ncbi:L7Ae/L30e/S12e/Gadd45 family ribosomal protein [Sporomusa acidovorans]|uniref:Ribosome-associated protein L7Ae-like protein n=1 Tax=Sporomusa acidovorans (strain ATCC 49682 / DSM 3132 / Mol) TaxID=1123286 RepID=A0ABZ3IXE1_SPOA4|nr:ribosomal L7Ae/L30e/S12e/Gadd45 family protein [Sporomusa acidovorans]OZC13906.1 ribosome-associated protein L7Ae-like protein [Sporomusa acidovorans DSM 3132]SDF74581.1 large subunit ribosomal protein L7A [Sporomusa acidovorans]